jgi:hypothetical protein
MKLVPEALNELNNFERGKDPKKTMDIGRTPERIFKELNNILEPLKIILDWDKDNNRGEGHYYAIPRGIEETPQIGYITDEASQFEYDEPGGFWMATEDGIDISLSEDRNFSHDYYDVVRELVKMKYGDINNIDKIIKKQEENIRDLKKIKKLLQR